MAREEKRVSTQPRFPQIHRPPWRSRVMCPRWPAAPEAPRRIAPSTRAAPPTPVPSVRRTAFRLPRAAPQSTSAIKAVRASLSARTGMMPASITSVNRRPSRKFRSPGRLFTRDVEVSIMPLQPIPIPQTCGGTCCRTRCTKSCRPRDVRGDGW